MTLQKANIKPQTSGTSAVANYIQTAEKTDSSAEDKKQTSPETLLVQKSFSTNSGSSGLPPSGTDNSSKRNNTQFLKSVIQTKLTSSNPSDNYEQEADRVPDKISQMPSNSFESMEMITAKDEK